MDYSFDPQETDLRDRLRALVTDELSAGFAGAFVEEPEGFEQTEAFCRSLADRGLLTMSWPAEHGGSDASLWAQTVVREEMWSAHEPRGPQYMGLNWVGPALMMYGAEQQKDLHLRPIAEGRSVWCQGFSEPGAGSDLAALQLQARRDGNGWRLNGQKIWTSYARMAQWCFLLARSSRGERKQDGITIFLIPMDRPGIEVRPIDALVGPHHLHEVFFTDVHASDDEILGTVDNGWEIVLAALAHERVGIARYARSLRTLEDAIAGVDWEDVAPDTRSRAAMALVHGTVAQLLNYRVIQTLSQGEEPGAATSIARIANTTYDLEGSDLALELQGPAGLLDRNDDDAPAHGLAESHWRYSQASTIAAGTLEVQRMIVSRSVL